MTEAVSEDSVLSELYDLLVLKGDFDSSETLLEKTVSEGYFDAYITQQEYHPEWKLINSDEVGPGMRGGHQICFDSVSETIFLLGGWSGHQNLSDLWSYHIPTKEWRLISSDVEAEGGPSPRSCHKMCCNSQTREIFIVGRYLDGLYRTAFNLKGDFYVYNIESNRWTLIHENTSLVGGPSLMFDHQVCMDTSKNTIYVFGGRILTPATCYSSAEERSLNEIGPAPTQQPQFSGLYSYHIPTNTWKCLNDDSKLSEANTNVLKARVGHCMLFHPKYRKLYIFGGQRNKEQLTDFVAYNVDTEHVEVISDSIKQDESEMPPLGVTQRATIDTELDEIYVLTGLSKDKERRDNNKAHSSFWVYSLRNYKWTCVYKKENVSEQYWTRMQHVEPCPRFAHQLVYDERRKVHYLFGGNPGRMCLPKVRLDDFWTLKLRRISHKEMIQRCKLLVRKCKFLELTRTNKIKALEFLQSGFTSLINPNNAEQEEQLQSLATFLFSETEIEYDKQRSEKEKTHRHRKRCELFETLCGFFPESMIQPKENLVDMISL